MQTAIPFIISLLAFILLVSGMVGIAVNLFYEDGLINFLLGKIWDMKTHTIVTVLPILVGIIVLFHRWSNRGLNSGSSSLSANILLILMMLAGGYFISLFISTGSLAYQPPF